MDALTQQVITLFSGRSAALALALALTYSQARESQELPPVALLGAEQISLCLC